MRVSLLRVSLLVPTLLSCLFLFSLLSSCQKNASDFKVSSLEGSAAPQVAKAQAQPQGQEQAPASSSYVIKEVIQTEKYTYLRVDEQAGAAAKDIWVASSLVTPKVGDHVQFDGLMLMENFESKALKKVFPKIFFTQTTTILGADTASNTDSKATAMATATDATVESGPIRTKDGKDPHAPLAEVKATVDLSGIKTADMKIADLFAQKDKLGKAQKVLKIRGKVVKYNQQIMGKNWLHVQDGSQGDLVVTTAATSQVGQTVVVEGKLTLNKDFGFGYKYDVLMEDAKVVVEK